MELDVVRIDKPDEMNVILGQAHFIKTIEDVHEALAGVSAQLRFGVAFCEASGPCLVRRSGNDARLVDLATENALAVAPFSCSSKTATPSTSSTRSNTSRRCAASSAPPPILSS